MAKRSDPIHQARLFDDSPTARAMEAVPPAAADPRVVRIASKLDPRARLGTSSWSFPGWAGLVYAREHSEADLARHGLAAYASHPLMSTVGLDRAFYKPLSVEEYAGLAELTPERFSFVIKAHQSVTRPDADERGRTFGDTAALAEKGVNNPLFLDASYAIDRVIGPASVGLRSRAGPIVMQFPPLDLTLRGRLGGAARFIGRVGEFLSRLPRAESDRWGGPRYVVEVRNREVLALANIGAWAEVLRAHGASHGWVSHPAMPPLAEQRRSLDGAGYSAAEQPVMCLRWLLIHTETYQSARDRYGPFNRLVDEDGPTRNAVVDLVRTALGAGRNAWVIANNKAEGSGPRTIERIAAELAAEAG